MDFTTIINRFKDILNCPLCSKSNQPLVRIRTCGHYMCENCSKKDKSRCLNCKKTYSKNDIVPNLLAQKCRELLQDYLIEKPAIKNGPLKNDIKTFVYQNNTYTMVTYKKPVKLNSKGESPLHRACKKKQSNVVRQRLEEAYDLNLKDFAGWTVLHEAVEAGSMFIIEMLLKSGALVNVPGGNNITPLHDAVMQGKVDLIKLLLDYGADVNMIDSKGSKPINYTDKDDIKEMLSKPPIEQTHHYKLWFCETITVYCHSISPEYVAKLRQSKFADVKTDFNVEKIPFTHFLIKKTHKLSLKILVALVKGLMFAPQEWIDDFLNGIYFIPIPNYEFCHDVTLNEVIRKAMLNSVLKLPRLFEGINFFISGHKQAVSIYNLNVNKSALSTIITSGGGSVLKREPTLSTVEGIVKYPFHANTNGRSSYCTSYIIYEENNPPELQYKMKEMQHKSSKWLIDCILNFTILL